MKQKHLLQIALLFITLISNYLIFSQSRGDIAFSSINFDGDDDFAIVTLADLTANSTIFFTDSNWDGVSAFAASEGTLSWNTGGAIIKAGQIIVFTDVDSDGNLNYGVSIGTLSTPDAGFNLSGGTGGDTMLAYAGTLGNPTTFLTGIKNAIITGGELDGTNLGGANLTPEIDFLEFNPTANPDGGIYNASLSDQVSYSDYLPILTKKVNWTHNTSDGEALLPFSQASFTINTTSWTGITKNWSIATNWNNGVPNSSSLATITNTGIAPEIDTSESLFVGNLNITHTNGLSILAGSLTVSGNITINTGSSLNLESKITTTRTIDAASLILNGTYTSADTHKFFYLTETFTNNTSEWTLVSSPTVGEKIDGNTVSNSNFAVFNKLEKNTTNYGIAFYDNSQSDTNLRWNYYSKVEVDIPTASATIDMTSGRGYSVLPNSLMGTKTANGNLGFKGAIATTNVQVAISNNSPAGNAFNLIGNPYPSFLALNTTAGTTASTTNLLTQNTNVLAEETIWLWDKTTASYITVNQTTTVGIGLNKRPSLCIAPAQGFFVKSTAAGGNFSFQKSMQSHQSSGTFNKPVNTRPEIQLNIINNGVSKNTLIYYYENKTTDFDNGYDSSIFEGVGSSFAVYTKLVSNTNARNLAIQTLPKAGYETMVIPVGVKIAPNSKITFAASSLNLPKEHKVYLEDKLHNVFTLLDVNSIYATAVKEAVTENRFYLHTKTSTLLSTKTEILDNISIFKTSNFNIRVTGLQRKKTTIYLYNISGKKLLSKTFEASTLANISLPKISSGIYIIKLRTKGGTINKKILL